jgi:hypothetical protein
MKPLSAAALAGAIFFFVSCGTVDYAKRYPKMVANADPVSAGTIELQFDRLLSSMVNKVDVEVIFYPRLNEVALEFKYEFITYRQFWDEAGRRQFASALELYKMDYAGRNLVNRHRRTRSIYGKVKGRAEWETFKYAKTYVSYPTIELGYRFKTVPQEMPKTGSVISDFFARPTAAGEAPFFTTFMRSARAEDETNTIESSQISIYFTRSQAEELVGIFDQDFLMGLLNKPVGSNAEDQIPTDPYNEWEG